MNRVILTGRVGNEPQVTTFQDGSQKVTVSLATSESWRDKTTGERKERTEWHTIVFPQSSHEVVLKYLTKGRRIEVEGKIRYRQHTKEDGTKSYFTEIDCSHFEFADSANSGNTNQNTSNQAANYESSMPNNAVDDLPY